MTVIRPPEWLLNNRYTRALALLALRTGAATKETASDRRLFINSLPKAGTHLLSLDLERLGLAHSRRHYTTHDVAAGASHPTFARLEDPALDERLLEDFLTSLQRLRPGQFATAHMAFNSRIHDAIASRGIGFINLYRDPRAILLSDFNYITSAKRHRLHNWLRSIGSKNEQYRALIDGSTSPGYSFPGHLRVLQQFADWLTADGVLGVRYEDLLYDPVLGDQDPSRGRTLASLASHAGTPAPTYTGPSSGVSATFRHGDADRWRTELPSEIQDYFSDRAGQLLAQYGYER